ncbi:MAG: formylglycine-generating enzyme family protein [Deltaproteobacteria bacterium]|nr:formylglycine-generating enzyme family protein [Deltaproteobacteria bacterium]
MKQSALMGLMAAVVISIGLLCAASDGGSQSGTKDAGPSTAALPDGGSSKPTPQCGPSPTGKGGPMCLVLAGPFMMGCNTAVDTECERNETPFHKVDVPAYRIDKYEVPTAEYKQCVTAGRCTDASMENPPIYGCNYDVPGKEKHPINCVNWEQAKAFCVWVGKRLPTEAEWEKAARGMDGRKYSWGDTSLDCDHAVWNSTTCGKLGTAPIGSKPLGTSPFGALDMIGNVTELVEDGYHRTYIGAPSDGSAWGTDISSFSVSRGGAWGATSMALRSSHRHYGDRKYRDAYIGFRCALSVP